MKPAPGDSPAGQALREAMVRDQIAARGIKDPRILDAFRRVPRHLFCPPNVPLAQAYADHPLPIGAGQTISQPYMVAEMTAWLAPKPGDVLLEIGTGSGYQAAILACLAARIHTIERQAELAESARARLHRLGFENVNIHVGDGTLGLPEYAPFNGIIVTAAAPETPKPLFEQLAPEARLVIPVGDRGVQDLIVWERRGNRFRAHTAGACRFVPLIGRFGWRR